MGKMNALSLLEARVSEVTEKFWDASEAEQAVLRAEYRTELQPALLAAYGAEGPAGRVDPWMAETYSELYKDRNGFRPNLDVPYSTMVAWMVNIPPLVEDDDAGEDDRFDPDISLWVEETDEHVLRIRDFEEVYGVSAMGQAMKFLDLRDY